MADPIIKIGSKGTAVKNAQKALNNRGAWLTVDGIFGSLTPSSTIKRTDPLASTGRSPIH